MASGTKDRSVHSAKPVLYIAVTQGHLADVLGNSPVELFVCSSKCMCWHLKEDHWWASEVESAEECPTDSPHKALCCTEHGCHLVSIPLEFGGCSTRQEGLVVELALCCCPGMSESWS